MKILYIDNQHVNCNYYSDIIKYLEKYNILKRVSLTNSVSNCVNNSSLNPDIIIIGFSITDCSNNYPKKIVNDTEIPLYIILNKEYTGLQKKLEWIKKLNPRKVFTVHHDYNKYQEITNIPFTRIMWSADHNIFKKYSEDYKYDLFFSGVIRKEQTNNWRNIIYNNLDKLNDYNIFINASFFMNEQLKKNNFKNLNNTEYAKALSDSKISLTTTGPVDLVGTRYFEIMATNKSLMICNRMDKEIYEDIVIENFNCVMFSSIDEFIEKIKYYLENEEERIKIVNNAYKHFIEKHTWDHKVKHLMDNL